MLYRHKRTGAEIDVNSIVGGDWEAVGPSSTKAASEAQKEEKATPSKKTRGTKK